MHRFFVPRDALRDGQLTLSGSAVHQIIHVLRLGVGQRIVVLDDSGSEYTVELERLAREEVTGRVVHQAEAVGEPAAHITLYQAVLKSDRFEWVLQKGTELGIVRFVPLLCSRVVPRDEEAAERKRARWERIIREAAEQSRRGRLPALETTREFADACQKAQQADGLRLLAWEEATTLDLKQVLRPLYWGADRPVRDERPPTRDVQLFIGPEGGFTSAEVDLARACGIRPITLGPRVLRAETAGVVCAAAILYELGDLA